MFAMVLFVPWPKVSVEAIEADFRDDRSVVYIKNVYTPRSSPVRRALNDPSLPAIALDAAVPSRKIATELCGDARPESVTDDKNKTLLPPGIGPVPVPTPAVLPFEIDVLLIGVVERENVIG